MLRAHGEIRQTPKAQDSAILGDSSNSSSVKGPVSKSKDKEQQRKTCQGQPIPSHVPAQVSIPAYTGIHIYTQGHIQQRSNHIQPNIINCRVTLVNPNWTQAYVFNLLTLGKDVTIYKVQRHTNKFSGKSHNFQVSSTFCIWLYL